MEENVNTGAPAEEAAEQKTVDAGQTTGSENLDSEFEELIKGKYKDAFAKRTQNIIDRRFRKEKEKKERSGEGGAAIRAASAIGVADEYGKMLSEAEETARAYPSFDLEAECRDKRFVALLSSGIGVKGAYEALHHGEIVAGAMQYAADRVLEAAQKGSMHALDRPTENGTVSGGAIDPKRDVSSLTGKDIRDILKRVERGEKIRF